MVRAGRLRGGQSVDIAVGWITSTGKKGREAQALALRTWPGEGGARRREDRALGDSPGRRLADGRCTGSGAVRAGRK